MQEPIRVAQIMGKLWAGGVEMVVFNYYRAIDKSKIQFDFYYDADSTVEPPQELIDMGARFIKIPPYQKLPQYLKTLKKHFRENNYKIVHSHINTLSVFPLYMAWRCGIPVRIAHNHSVPSGKEIKRDFLKQVLRRFSTVFPTDYFACSERAGRWLFGNKLADEKQVFIMRNAIDFDRFLQNYDKTQTLKKELGIQGKRVIGHVGRFTFAKNHMFLLELFKEYSVNHTDAILVLIGDGELHNDILTKIDALDLSDRVVLVGKVSNPQDYYGIIDVLVLPSVFEGLPLTVIEAQISGIPVIMSEVVSDDAIISNGVRKVYLEAPLKKWINEIDSSIGIKIVLNDKARNYDVRTQVIRLEEWYISHEKKVYGEE